MNSVTDVVEQPKPWLARDIQNNSQWIRKLSQAEKSGLRHGLSQFLEKKINLEDSTAEDFPFRDIETLIQDINDQLYKGFGLIVLKGFPIEGLDEASIKQLYWGFTNHLGVLRPQGKDSALVNHVKNTGGTYRAAGGRGYNTNAELDFHVDFADFVGLLCIQDAKSGGVSKTCSSRALFETLKQQSPHLAQALMEPLFYSRQNEQAPDELPYYQTPIVAFEQGWFSCRYTRNHIRYADQHEGAAAPSALQNEAMDWIDQAVLSDTFTFDMKLIPGDFQILNNHVVLHSRTAYEDYEEPDKRRSLLRSWIATPNSQPLSPLMRAAFHDHRARAVRGGIKGQAFDEQKRAYTRKAAAFHAMLFD